MVSLSSDNFLLQPIALVINLDNSQALINLRFLHRKDLHRQRPPPAAASGSNGAVVTSVVAVGDVRIRIEHL
nr:hypothetical protein Iba_chr10bCG2520 [Ipomoea batatas]